MTTRRWAREVAFRLLYELELNPDVPQHRREQYLREHIRDPQGRQYAQTLIDGVRTKRPQLDQIIQELVERWSLERIGVVERVLLRIGLFEMLFQPDVPPAVAISEAVRLARRYGERDSHRFVNGVLDAARRRYTQAPAPDAAAGGEAVAEETV